MANLEFCVSCDELLNSYGEEVFRCGDAGPFCVDCWRDHKCCGVKDAEIGRLRKENSSRDETLIEAMGGWWHAALTVLGVVFVGPPAIFLVFLMWVRLFRAVCGVGE